MPAFSTARTAWFFARRTPLGPAEPMSLDEQPPLVTCTAARADPIGATNHLRPQPSAAAAARAAASRRLAAVLRFDSWACSSLARGLRSPPADARHLLFSAMGRDIDLRITPAEQHFALAGQILGPDESGSVELTPQAGQGQSSRSAAIDALGEFRLDGVRSGTYRLTLRIDSDEVWLPPIDVSGRRG
jgi:hypothetical protein